MLCGEVQVDVSDVLAEVCSEPYESRGPVAELRTTRIGGSKGICGEQQEQIIETPDRTFTELENFADGVGRERQPSLWE